MQRTHTREYISKKSVFFWQRSKWHMRIEINSLSKTLFVPLSFYFFIQYLNKWKKKRVSALFVPFTNRGILFFFSLLVAIFKIKRGMVGFYSCIGRKKGCLFGQILFCVDVCEVLLALKLLSIWLFLSSRAFGYHSDDNLSF